MGYANAVARYLANLFGAAPGSQKNQKSASAENGGPGGGTAAGGTSNPSGVRKRSSVHRVGSGGFGTANQGDATSYLDESSAGAPGAGVGTGGATGTGSAFSQSMKPSQRKKPLLSTTNLSSVERSTPNKSPSSQGALPSNSLLLDQPNEEKVVLKNKLDHRDSVSLAIFDGFRLRYVKFLGAGGQGEVHQVADCVTNEQFALKIIKQNSAAKKYEKEALEAIREKPHPGIIHLEAAIEDEDFLYLLTQFVEGLTVRDIIPYMEQFSWDRKREFVIPLLAELCLSIDYLHQLGYVHRDIKASNCFLDMNGHVTIGDFGSCIQKSLIKARVIFGTVPYTISPEMFCKVPYGVEADYWGIGVLACELLLGFFPFDWFTRDEIKSKETVNEVINTIKCPQIPSDIPEDVQRVLYAFLSADPKKRLGSPFLGGIESIEGHPFFEGIHWGKFKNSEYRTHPLPVLKLMKAIQKKKAAKAEQAARAQAAAEAAAAAGSSSSTVVRSSVERSLVNQSNELRHAAGEMGDVDGGR